MSLAYIFYALIVEDNKTLKMHGPFVHCRPEVEKVGWPAYIFNKADYQSERKFLSKFLRTKNSSKISTFHCIDIKESSIDFTCANGHKMKLNIVDCNNDFVCPSCNVNESTKEELTEEEIEAKVLAKELAKTQTAEKLIGVGKEHTQSSLFKAIEHFEKTFEQMRDNYMICSRKR